MKSRQVAADHKATGNKERTVLFFLPKNNRKLYDSIKNHISTISFSLFFKSNYSDSEMLLHLHYMFLGRKVCQSLLIKRRAQN